MNVTVALSISFMRSSLIDENNAAVHNLGHNKGRQIKKGWKDNIQEWTGLTYTET